MKSDDWLYSAPMPEKLSWKMNGEKWKQIAGNLLNYAGSFTPPSGRIRFKLEGDYDSKSLNLNDCDSGIGVDKKLQKRLFSGGGDIWLSGSDGEVSTGIGMVTIQKYVKLHLGNILVDSTPGKGMTIHITMPN